MATFGVTENTDSGELSTLVATERCIQREITLKANCGALSRGTVLEMVSASAGTWQQLQAASPTNARAILAEDVTNNATATQKAQAYFVGKYREEDLVWPSGITTVNKRSAIQSLQDRGIILDEAILSVSTTTTTTTTTSTSSTTTTTTA